MWKVRREPKPRRMRLMPWLRPSTMAMEMRALRDLPIPCIPVAPGRYGEAFASVETTLTWGKGLKLEELASRNKRFDCTFPEQIQWRYHYRFV